MNDALCLLAVVPVRKEPAHRSEMVSQLLFGEQVNIVEEKDDFLFVKTTYDGYQGWVQASQITILGNEHLPATNAYTTGFANTIVKDNSLLHVPFGVQVYGGNDLAFSVAGYQIKYLLQPQQVWHVGGEITKVMLEALSQPFLNAPYLWGGKSVFGVDCSGFVQQVYKLLGIPLLRDAYLQEAQGTVVNSLEEARWGDLGFFKNDAGRVTHVGIILDENKIMHASGNVRIDAIDEEGIVIETTGKRTHRHLSIRRLF